MKNASNGLVAEGWSTWVLSQEQILSLARDLEQRFPQEFQILELAGVSPFGSRPMNNPYLNTMDTEDFSNVGRHCVSVTYVANAIASALLAQWFISDSDRNEIIKASLLHDGDKRLEVMRKNAKNAWVAIDPYGEAWYKTIETIFSDVDRSTLGFIKNMWGMTGHNSLKKFLAIDEAGKISLNLERTLAEMIVHIADDMTHSSLWKATETTQFVSIEDRARLGRFSARYPFLWNEGFSLRSDGTIVDIKQDDYIYLSDHKKSFYEWQKYVFHAICDHIAWILYLEWDGNGCDSLLRVIKNPVQSVVNISSQKISKGIQ